MVFGGVGGEGGGPEPVVVGARGVVQGYLAGLGELVSFYVEFDEEVAVVGDVECGFLEVSS